MTRKRAKAGTQGLPEISSHAPAPGMKYFGNIFNGLPHAEERLWARLEARTPCPPPQFFTPRQFLRTLHGGRRFVQMLGSADPIGMRPRVPGVASFRAGTAAPASMSPSRAKTGGDAGPASHAPRLLLLLFLQRICSKIRSVGGHPSCSLRSDFGNFSVAAATAANRSLRTLAAPGSIDGHAGLCA
jgi:hypothetical protein